MQNLDNILSAIRSNSTTIRREVFSPEQVNIDELVRAFASIGEAMNGRYVIDANNEACIRNLIKWLFADPSLETIATENGRAVRTQGNIRKGIYLYGPTGTGKSLCMAILARMAYYFNVRVARGGSEPESLSWMNFRTDDIVESYTHGSTLTEFKKQPFICFNDLGAEPTDAIYMGQRMNVMRSIIEARGDMWASTLTFFTSNIPLDSPDLMSLYGDRAVSRLRQMCNFLVLGGKDRRR